MEQLFQAILSYRIRFSSFIEKAGDAKLDIVPPGFISTVRWHLAHLVASQSFLTYGLTQQPSPLVSEEFIASARKGTTQEDFSVNEDYGTRHLLEFLIETTKQLQRDFKTLKKHDFSDFETSTGLMLRNLDSALAFSAVHDGVHMGQIHAMLRVLG